MRELLLVGYCGAVGLVAAGIAASLYKMVTQKPAGFSLLGESWVAAFTTFLFCALTGPAIILDYMRKIRLAERNAVGMLFGGLLVALIWSVCSGILVLSFVLTLRDSLA